MINSADIDQEVRRICSMFHFGWVLKKNVEELERDVNLYKNVQVALNVMGYELVNITHCDWYGIRLKKELETQSFEPFYKMNIFQNGHMALITMLYIHLVMPVLNRLVTNYDELYMTIEQISLRYGDKFKKRTNSDPIKIIKQLIGTLKRHHFVIQKADRFYAGPMLFMVRREMVDTVISAIIAGLADEFKKAASEPDEVTEIDDTDTIEEQDVDEDIIK